MLSTILSTSQTTFGQKLYYFKYNRSVIASEIDSRTVALTPHEMASFQFSAFVEHKLYTNWDTEDIFSGFNDVNYVPIATFDNRLIKIDSLEEKLRGKKLSILGRNIKTLNYQQILEDCSKDNKFLSYEVSRDLSELQICIRKSTFRKILDNIKENPDHDITGITFNLSEGESIWLIQMRISNEGHDLRMYWPQRYLFEVKTDIIHDKNLSSYFEKYEGISMHTFLLVNKLISERTPQIKKDGKQIFLDIDERFTMFLYCTKNIPKLNIFGEFTIELQTFYLQDLVIHANEKFKHMPTMAIAFSKTKNVNENNINLQISQYKYSVPQDIYCRLNDIIYRNIHFDDKPYITFESKEIDLHTIIRTPKNLLSIEIYFDKLGLSYEDEIYEALEESIDDVIFVFFNNEKEQISIDKKLFKITNSNTTFNISLDHTIFSMKVFSSITSALKNKNCVLNISVRRENRTIIENIICLNGIEMVIVSSNRLIEILNIMQKENEYTSLTSKPSGLKVGPPSYKVTKKHETEFSQEKGRLREDKKASFNTNSPQTRKFTGIESANEAVQTVLPSKDNHFSDNEKKDGKSNRNSKTGVSRPSTLDNEEKGGKSKRHPKTGVTEPSTLDNSLKTENINTLSNLKNTFEKEKSKPGNTILKIVLIVVAFVSILGLVAYLYFF